jgi:hypothetical protein
VSCDDNMVGERVGDGFLGILHSPAFGKMS